MVHYYYFDGEKKRKSETSGKRRVYQVNKWRNGGITESKPRETKWGTRELIVRDFSLLVFR